jgi:hypothetical protein
MSLINRIARIAGTMAAAALLAATADATLIVRDYATPGDGLITYDSRTGLEWLDLSVSFDRAPASALATYSSFHMASLDEAESLFVSAGVAADHIKTNVQTYYTADAAAGAQLVNAIGANYLYPTSAYIYGRVLRPDGVHYDVLEAGIGLPGNRSPGMWSKLVIIGNTLSGWQNTDADFLVRTAAPVGGVPEPASWTMLILGFGAVGGALRRRRTGVSLGRAARP